MEIFFILIVLSLVLWLNFKASYSISHDQLSEPLQRKLQLTLVWLIPMLGALVVLAVHRPAEKASGKYPEKYPLPDDFPGHSARKSADLIDSD